MSVTPHTGRVRLYVHADQNPKQVTELVARLVELSIPEAAISKIGFETDDGSPPIRQEILADAQAGRYEILVVNNLDEISDDAVEISRILIQLDNAGVTVIALAEHFCSDASLTEQLFTPSPNKEH